MPKKIHIIGGGTVSHVRAHLALAAPAYGTTAKALNVICLQRFPEMDVNLHLTKMAGGRRLETNGDVAELLEYLIAREDTKIIFMNAAIVDFYGTIVHGAGQLPIGKDGVGINSGKYAERLSSRAPYSFTMQLSPEAKLLRRVREQRKDIFLVAFKATCGEPEDEQYEQGLRLCKEASANLVFVNDTKTVSNMIVCPEESRYRLTKNRTLALEELADMTWHRSHLTFTRSTVVAGSPIPWGSGAVPVSLRTVVDHCIARGAYKPFRGVTAGHFACKLSDTEFLTSIRKTDFNDLSKNGLVRIVTDGPDTVMAYGAKPSVGGQSQRIVFHDHPGYDCILHFHCPKKQGSAVPTVSQREFECGSHECGANTSNGLQGFGNLLAVYLDHHGPNIVFSRDIDPQEVIRFIEMNFNLDDKTGGAFSKTSSKKSGQKTRQHPDQAQAMAT